jgi:hypothetical protein
MKSTWRPSYRPSVETLESRLQPGSILAEGVGLCLHEAALELSSLLADNSSGQAHSLSRYRATDKGGNPTADGSQIGVSRYYNTPVLSQPAVPVVTKNTAGTDLASEMAAISSAGEQAIGVSRMSGHAVVSEKTSASSSSARESAIALDSAPTRLDASRVGVQKRSAASLHRDTDFHVLSSGQNDGGIQPLDTLNWISYFGNAGSKLNKSGAMPDGSGVIVAGTIQNSSDPTEYDAVVAELNSAGASLIGQVVLGLGSGSRSSVNGLAVDASGVIYASGTGSVGGVNTAFAERISNITSGVPDWRSAVGFGINDVANSCQLDAAGANLYVTGITDASGNGGRPGALLIVQLDTPTGLTGTNYGYNYANGDSPLPVTGNDIAVASTGGVDVAIQEQAIDGNYEGYGVAPNPATGPALTLLDSPGPHASMSSILVDATDRIYLSGTGYNGTETTTRNTVGFAAANGSFISGVDWGVVYPGGYHGNWVSGGLALNSDLTPATSGTIDDNSGGVGSHATVLVHWLPDASYYIDAAGIGSNPAPVGSNDDYAAGVVIGSGASGSVYYQDGWTSSTDFNVTPGAYQQRYGGDPYCGWVASITLR